MVGVASERDVLVLEADSDGAAKDVLALLDEHHVAGKQLHVAGDRLTLVISRENLHEEARVRDAIAARSASACASHDTLGAVSVVGAGINASFENVRRGSAALAGDGMAVAAIATSSFRITWMIDRARLDDAVRLLHGRSSRSSKPCFRNGYSLFTNPCQSLIPNLLIPDMTTVLDRFLRYVRYDTQSNEQSTTYPSTDKQLVLLRDLVAELKATRPRRRGDGRVRLRDGDDPGDHDASAGVPAIGFIAHVDTSPEMRGADVKPIVHRGYDGRDLVLPDDPAAVLRLADIPALAEQIGHDIVTASGTTLLGADNKAGVAEIVTAAAYLVAHPGDSARDRSASPSRRTRRSAAARSTSTSRAFGAHCAYTMDGGSRGEIEIESFSADAMTVTFHGFNTHPGYAKGRMVNAIKVAAAFIDALPHDALSPETTDGYEGFVHPYVVQAGVERTSVQAAGPRLRDRGTEGEGGAGRAARQRGGGALSRRARRVRGRGVVPQHARGARRHPEVAEHAREAIRRAGLEPHSRPIRGGTDGSRLSFMGLPTPNIFAGEHNFHSRLEWVSVQDMEKAVEVIVHLCQVWEERSRD